MNDAPPATLVDSHCHLDFPEFSDELPAIIERARQAGVTRMVSIGTRIRQAAAPLAIAREHDGIFCTVGTHPHNAEDEQDIPIDHLTALAADDRVIGIGETGLDFFYDHSPRDIQEKVFCTHIEAARRTGLPLVIHTRDADADMDRILRREMGKGPFKAVLHCFSSGRALAETAMELGLYLSFSGILTFKAAAELRAIAADMPLERLLVETDAPFLAPVPLRGKRNEPAFVRHTAAKLAEIRGLGYDELATATTGNFLALFKRAAP